MRDAFQGQYSHSKALGFSTWVSFSFFMEQELGLADCSTDTTLPWTLGVSTFLRSGLTRYLLKNERYFNQSSTSLLQNRNREKELNKQPKPLKFIQEIQCIETNTGTQTHRHIRIRTQALTHTSVFKTRPYFVALLAWNSYRPGLPQTCRYSPVFPS